MIIASHQGPLLAITSSSSVWDRGVIIVEKLVRSDRIKILHHYHNMFVFHGIMQNAIDLQ